MTLVAPRSIIAEDLDRIVADMPDPARNFAGTTVLVTGAAGFLCSYLVESIAALNASGLAPTLSRDRRRQSAHRRVAATRASRGAAGRPFSPGRCHPSAADRRARRLDHSRRERRVADVLSQTPVRDDRRQRWRNSPDAGAGPRARCARRPLPQQQRDLRRSDRPMRFRHPRRTLATSRAPARAPATTNRSACRRPCARPTLGFTTRR